MRPRRTATVAVHGELGWLGVHCIRLPRLASLFLGSFYSLVRQMFGWTSSCFCEICAIFPSALRAAYVSRWSSIIAVAAQRALASFLLELLLDTVASAAGDPDVHEVLQDERWFHAPASSRLPARA